MVNIIANPVRSRGKEGCRGEGLRRAKGVRDVENTRLIPPPHQVNSTVPIAAEVMKKYGVYDPQKMFGVTTLVRCRPRATAAARGCGRRHRRRGSATGRDAGTGTGTGTGTGMGRHGRTQEAARGDV